MATTSFPADAGDWKGRFIYDLAASLGGNRGIRIGLWGPPGDLPPRVATANSPADAAWLKRMSDAGGIAHLLRTRPVSGLVHAAGIRSRLRNACRRRAFDIYHMNWLQLALGLPDDGRPAYVSVLGSDYGLLRLPGVTQLLRRAFARRHTLLAPNAEWMAPRLQREFGDVARVVANPFGVSPFWFEVTRDPVTPAEWLVVSRVTRAKLGRLLDWGSGLFGKDRRLVLLGPMQESIDLPDWVDYRGSTDPQALAKKWFPRATGLLTLSQHHEGRPQVMIEALAAGLPVVATRLPAHLDLLEDNETGWLVGSSQALTRALEAAEQPEVSLRVGETARQRTRKRIGTWDDHAARCVTAYHALLETGSCRAG